jgi:hypothetical protein
MAAVYSPCLLIWYKISTVHPTLAFTIYDIQNLYYIQNLKSASYSGIYYRTPLYTYIYIYINSIDSINIVYIHTKCYRGVDIHYRTPLYIYIYIYIYIGKEKCNQCNILKNLLDEKGIQYHYVDVSKIPPELLTYLRMYCNSYPIVLGVKYFSTFNETLEHFQDI